MIEIQGTPLTYDLRSKEKRLYNEIAAIRAEVDRAYKQIDNLIASMQTKDTRLNELNVILKAARKKTRSRKVWKTKEAEGIK